MGIRVNKVMGYGLLDLDQSESKVDPRIDIDGFTAAVEEEDLTLPKLLAWLQERRPLLHRAVLDEVGPTGRSPGSADVEVSLVLGAMATRIKNEKVPQWSAYNMASHDDDEGTLPGVVCVTPPDQPDWVRWDNIIDHTEEELVYGGEDRVALLPMGIYPFSGTLVQVRPPQDDTLWPRYEAEEIMYTGLESKSWNPLVPRENGPIWMGGGTYNRLLGKWSENSPALVGQDMIDHLEKDWRPILPAGVIACLLWMDHAGVLPNGMDGMKKDMRAMLYVNWR